MAVYEGEKISFNFLTASIQIGTTGCFSPLISLHLPIKLFSRYRVRERPDLKTVRDIFIFHNAQFPVPDVCHVMTATTWRCEGGVRGKSR